MYAHYAKLKLEFQKFYTYTIVYVQNRLAKLIKRKKKWCSLVDLSLNNNYDYTSGYQTLLMYSTFNINEV